MILAPERYDPRRAGDPGTGSTPLREIARSVREFVNPKTEEDRPYLIVDTTHSHDGVLCGNNPPTPLGEAGSIKKVARAGDVLVSRLRPYLRQVAYVDADIPGLRGDIRIACSTEYYVLRSVSGEPISFLVPYLLCESIQAVLAACQEGGHHPRVPEDALLDLRVPADLLESRSSGSLCVENAVRHYRQADREMREAVRSAQEVLGAARRPAGGGALTA